MKRLLFFIFALFFLCFPSADAQEPWQIKHFQSTLQIRNDGIVRVTEQITVDFRELEKHGIFREIPYVYTDEQGAKTYSEIQVTSVKRNNNKEPFDTYTSNDFYTIKIGDKDKIVSGFQSYTIEYIVKGVLRGSADHDELFWNVTGNNWEVPIQKTDARVTIEGGKVTKTACFKGYAGSTEPCLHNLYQSDALYTENAPLTPGEGMTIVAGFDKGIVPILTVPRPKTFLENLMNPLSIGIFLVALLIGFVAVFWTWFKNGRDYWFGNSPFSGERSILKPIGAHETITVAFEPPQKLRPAELGVLMDERADTLDVVATIIDLARRKYLTITEIKKKWLFGKTDYTFTKLAPKHHDLLPYEEELYERLFKTGTTVSLASLKTKFYEDLSKVKKKLYLEMVTKKYFIGDPEATRTKYLVISILLFATAVGLCILAASINIGYLGALGGGLALPGLLGLFLSQKMSRRSALGRQLYGQSKGLRLFISGAEKHRQVFYENKNLFHELLPYAIVFGLTEKFAKSMDEIGIKPSNPTWYTGSTPFHAATFGNTLNSFSSSLSGAIASTPKSSGFSGGSSGGGFGGGGGGSW